MQFNEMVIKTCDLVNFVIHDSKRISHLFPHLTVRRVLQVSLNAVRRMIFCCSEHPSRFSRNSVVYVLGSIPNTQELNTENVKEIAMKHEYQQTNMDILMHITLFTSKMWP